MLTAAQVRLLDAIRANADADGWADIYIVINDATKQVPFNLAASTGRAMIRRLIDNGTIDFSGSRVRIWRADNGR